MTEQKPLGPADMVCPMHRKAMNKVCHKCPLWILLPNEQNTWQCAFVWAPQLAFRNAQETFAVGKEMNELRNETKASRDHNVAMGAIAVQRATDAVRSTIAEVVEGKYRPALPLHEADQKALPSA
jgi:hypothetical protein